MKCSLFHGFIEGPKPAYHAPTESIVATEFWPMRMRMGKLKYVARYLFRIIIVTELPPWRKKKIPD